MSDSPLDHAAVTPTPIRIDPALGIAARRDASIRFDNLLGLLERAHIPLVLITAFLLASFAVRNSDFWMHLATGKKIVAGDYKFIGPGNDPFGLGTEKMRWVNHAWLYDVLLYAVWSVRGGAAVVVVKALMVALLAGVLLLLCRPAVPERILPGTKANPTGWFAAIIVTIALIAIAPRMLLQPTVLSFLFLALTVFVLVTQITAPQTWRLPAMLGGLFFVWVNCDAWFVLGPLAVLLFFVGEVVQRIIPGSAKTDNWQRVQKLGIGLGVGLAACLVNPDFHNAFELPFELYAPQISDELRTDRQFRSMFLSPLDSQYHADAQLGKTPAGIAFAGLLLFAVAAFALNFSHVHWSHLLLTAGFAFVSMRNWRAIPFFVIVAAPLIVRNLHAWFARRAERTFDEAEPLAAAPISAQPPQHAGGVALTPARLAAFLGLTGRLLTFVLALAAAVLAYFGRLHTNPNYVTYARPAAWSVLPDPSLERAARQLQDWREAGRLPPEASGYHSHPDVANYCAWFAPSEKGFFDYRFRLWTARTHDYLQVRKKLQESLGMPISDEIKDVFRKYNLQYVVYSWISDADLSDGMFLTGNMFLNTKEWSLWQVAGRVTVAGWVEPNPKVPLKADFVRAAFGPQAAIVPPPGKGRLVVGEDGLLQWPSPWENYLNPIKPDAPEAVSSAVYMLLHGAARNVAREQIKTEYRYAVGASVAGLVCDRLVWSVFGRFLSYSFSDQSIENEAWARTDNLAALPLLAVRAARQGLASQPDDPRPYLALSRASKDFMVAGPVQSTQVISVLRQGLARVAANEERRQSYERTTTETFLELTRYYLTPQYDEILQRPLQNLDLAVECLHEVLKRFRTAPPADTPPDEIEAREKQLAEQLKSMEGDLRPKQDNFVLGSKGRPVLHQFFMARQFGLTRDALRVLVENRLNLDPEGAYQLVRMHLLLGQVDEAKNYLTQVRIEDLPPQYHYRFRALQVETWVAAGQLDEAGKELENMITAMKGHLATLPLGLTQVTHGHLASGFVDPNMAPMARELLAWLWLNSLQPMTVPSWLTLAMLYAHRGMIALEEGDNATAQLFLQKALEIPINFEGRPVAERYLALLKREAAR